MHGNVAEWTASDYLSYNAEKSVDTSDVSLVRKVVRGGSWNDRPKDPVRHTAALTSPIALCLMSDFVLSAKRMTRNWQASSAKYMEIYNRSDVLWIRNFRCRIDHFKIV